MHFYVSRDRDVIVHPVLSAVVDPHHGLPLDVHIPTILGAPAMDHGPSLDVGAWGPFCTRSVSGGERATASAWCTIDLPP